VWAVCIRRSDADSLGRLWRIAGIKVCEDEGNVWLRGCNVDEITDNLLRTLPSIERFTVLPDRQLIASGNTVPKGFLPEGTWTDLREWMSIRLPTAGFGGDCTNQVALRLIRCHIPLEPNLLVTTWTIWSDYTKEAAQIRLDPLSFAMTTGERVAVRGTPLPPIRGHRFVQQQGVATPVGWTWTPSVDPDVVRESLRLETNDLALLHTNGEWDHILADDFVQASRSAVRISMGDTLDA
jgi:hypothetical protein